MRTIAHARLITLAPGAEPGPQILREGRLRWLRQCAGVRCTQQLGELTLRVLPPALDRHIASLALPPGVSAHVELEPPAVFATTGNVAPHDFGSFRANDWSRFKTTLAISSRDGVCGLELISPTIASATALL